MSTYFRTGHYDQMENAKNYLHKAEELAMNIHDRGSLSYIYSGWGNYYFKNERYTKSLDYFQKSVEISIVLEDDYLMFKGYSNIALCYSKLEQYKLSSLFYSKALEKAIWLNLLPDQALILFNLGVEYYNRGLQDSAISYFKKSIRITHVIDDKYMESKNYEFLSDSYSQKNEFRNAFESHKNYSRLQDSLLNLEKISSIAEMQTKYETEKKEQQIVLLGEQNKTKEAQRNLLLAAASALLLVVLILGVLYVQRKKIAKKDELIAEQKIEGLLDEQEIKTYNAMLEGQEEERMRIATDLHDRLGSMLSTVKLLFSALDEKIDQNQVENKQQYEKANSLLDEACVEVRRVSHNLGTGMVANFGLVRALEELCESIDQSGKISNIQAYGLEGGLKINVEVGIYRMVQEIVNNTLKYSKANNLTLQFNHEEEMINIMIEDDGLGFNLSEAKEKGGMGLRNLEMRVSKLGGTVHIDTKKGRGTTTIIEIPINLNA
ncbi:MAG: sensor histidine kinase [Flavobacteriales bacterium]|nr:sensor histidine kinase [Flavobacteriales bacterium]